jgi:hypothetical protein
MNYGFRVQLCRNGTATQFGLVMLVYVSLLPSPHPHSVM